MPENNRRKANGKHLPRRHDDSKGNGTKFLDSVKDKNLAGRRCNGSDNVVSKCIRICVQEFNHHGQVARQNQTRRGYKNGRDVYSQHHLVGVDVLLSVLYVDFVLPLARERIKGDVHEKIQETNDFSGGILLRILGKNGKYGNTHGNQHGFEILIVPVVGSL